MNSFQIYYRLLYRDDGLPLHWNIDPGLASAFPESDFICHEEDRDGVLFYGNDFFLNGRDISLNDLEKSLGTANMVTRWRAANPDIDSTENDCVRATVREARKVISPGGVWELKQRKA